MSYYDQLDYTPIRSSNNRNIDFSRERYERARSNSRNGERQRVRRTEVYVEPSIFDKLRSKAVAVGLAVVMAASIGGAVHAVDNYKNDPVTIGTTQFHEQYIEGQVYRLQPTVDNPNNWGYDHIDIADGINNAENVDEAIYYCYLNIGGPNTGQVLIHTDVLENKHTETPFTDYFTSRGFESEEEYAKFMNDIIHREYELSNNSNEIDNMLNEHNMTPSHNVESNSKGII